MPTAEDAVAVGAKAIWLQLGVINESAVSYAADRGLITVSNRCIKVDYAAISR
jgi:predicted CoA-binding protein